MSLFTGKELTPMNPTSWAPWHIRFKHWFLQRIARRKPTCSYCALTCEPQYGERCEVCDEYPEASSAGLPTREVL